jgi:hypothetical protein
LTRIRGVLRIAPVLLPVCVTMITGSPVSRSVVPCVPPLPSYLNPAYSPFVNRGN